MAPGHRVPQGPFPPQRGAAHRSLERASRLRPPAHLGTGPRGRHAASEEYDDEHKAGLVVVRKKAYPFTIGGAALGLLLGIALVISKVRSASEEIPEMERRMIEEAKVEALKNRKDSFAAEQKEKKTAVARQLTRLKTIPDADKRDFLLQALPGLCDLPSGQLLGQALMELGPPPGTPGGSASLPEEAETAAAFKKQKEEAEALHAQGKLGDAITKIYDNYLDYKAHHGAEIDESVERWSNELTAKWKADLLETERLLLNAETGKAQEILKKALEYGDGPIRKEAQQRIEAIQTQVALTQDDEKTQEGEGESELEKEFQEQSEGSDTVEPDSGSGADSGQGEGAGPDEGMGPEEGPPGGEGSGADGGPDPEESVGGDDPAGDESGDDF